MILLIRSICITGRKGVNGKENTETVIKCQWAHLPRDEYTTIFVLEAYSLDMIFVMNSKFEDRCVFFNVFFKFIKIGNKYI